MSNLLKIITIANTYRLLPYKKG